MSRAVLIQNKIRANAGFLAMCAVVVALSVFMSTDAQTAHLFGWEVPPLCVFKAFLGRECWGCGLTRSFIFTAHGQVHDGFDMHKLGPILWVACAAQIPYRGVQIWRLKRELQGLDPGPEGSQGGAAGS